MSETVRVYGVMLSGPVRYVVAFCRLSGIPFELVKVDLVGKEHLTEDYAKINPFQAVPAITHGDYSLWESGAIVTYLAETFGTDNQWYPKDLKIRARINAYLHWHQDGVRKFITNYMRPKYIFPKFFGAAELSPEVDAKLRTEFEEVFEVLKWLIADTGFVARTQEASIADVFACCDLTQSKFINFSFEPFPEVKAWYDKIMSEQIIAEVNQAVLDLALQLN